MNDDERDEFLARLAREFIRALQIASENVRVIVGLHKSGLKPTAELMDKLDTNHRDLQAALCRCDAAWNGLSVDEDDEGSPETSESGATQVN